MNKIENLINEYCPNGVEFAELSKLTDISTGQQLNKELLFDDGKYPVFNGGILQSGFYDKYNNDANTIIISQGGASAGYVNFIKTKFYAGAHCYVIKIKSNKLINKFCYYVLKNKQEKIQQSKTGAGIPGLNRKKIFDLRIPLPPLEVQREIVRILDNFTELEARKQQYEYYRDKLFDFDENDTSIKFMTLGEIATDIYRGAGIKREDVTDKGIPCVRYGEIYTTYNIWFDKCVSYTTENAIKTKNILNMVIFCLLLQVKVLKILQNPVLMLERKNV